MAFIKTYSNFVIKQKHKDSNVGNIYERDITTIGGLNQFAPGQIPIYKSGNFIITINNEKSPSRYIKKVGWEENNEGRIWNRGIIDENYELNPKFSFDEKIVLKEDYYNLKDFAYFGSLSEMIRADVNDIMKRFPGELYYNRETSSPIYYIINDEEKVISGNNGNVLFFVQNPFLIDIHKEYIDIAKVSDKLKYFAAEGYKNYDIIASNGNKYGITSYDVNLYENVKYCVGNVIGEVTIHTESGNIKLYIGVDGNLQIVYLIDKNDNNFLSEEFHIRPKEAFYEDFINSLDSFQRIILNKQSEPKYRSVFEVIGENEFGYYTQLEEFVFPMSDGFYNIGGNGTQYTEFINKFVNIASFYDERFCDNLYRSMTHEAIKNFDWSFRKEEDEDIKEENTIGGNKIEKLIRLYGREFDEIKRHIDNLSKVNTITYDDSSNMADYFFTDSLEMDGWDLKMVYPLNLIETTPSGETIDSTTVEEEKNNEHNGQHIIRTFYQDTTLSVKPYSIENISEDKRNGYFLVCGNSSFDVNPKTINIGAKCSSGINFNVESKIEVGCGSQLITIGAEEGQNSIIDECQNKVRWKLKKYSSEKEFTTPAINTEFFRRFKINSKYILRNKGTKHGIEMMLSLFGLKSKEWYDALTDRKKISLGNYDYDIKEYTVFTKPLKETWNESKKDYDINWHNRNKLISYDTASFKNGDYVDYQGLPVKKIDIPNESGINDRYLVPHFDRWEIYDGNPTFQMNGGWKSIYPFVFDLDNNILIPNDEDVLNTETYSTIRRVETLEELMKVPGQILKNGTIYYVNDLSVDYAIVDGVAYRLTTDDNGNDYFSVYVMNNSLRIGNAVFTDYVIVSNPYDGNEIRTVVSDRYNGYEVRVYIVDDTINAYSDEDSISTLSIFKNGSKEGESGYSHFFKINNVNFSGEFSEDGWKQIKENSYDYYKINTVKDYISGNNPHIGNFIYDEGREYFSYFNHLFKYPYENNLFDMRCYNEGFSFDEIIPSIGFEDLKVDTISEYNGLLTEDTKIHYFGKSYQNNEEGGFDYYSLADDRNPNASMDENHYLYSIKDVYANRTPKIVDGQEVEGTLYGEKYEDNEVLSGATEQIMNTKKMDISFYVRSEEYTKEYLQEVKYIQDVILPYVEQMIPPTTIWSVHYVDASKM